MSKNYSETDEPGIYLVSFDDKMKYPMVYHEVSPWSLSYVSNSMVKVGKVKDSLKGRLDQYRTTYGYRECEPNQKKVRDYWSSQGYDSISFKKCFGCDVEKPHNHVKVEFLRSTFFISTNKNYLDQEIHPQIEEDIKNQFRPFLTKGHYAGGRLQEYYQSHVKNDIKEFLKELLLKYE